MPPASKKKKNTREYIWIYGCPTLKEGCFEFHPNVQEHIETSYNRGKKMCQIYVFGDTWDLDFVQMIRTKKDDHDKYQIKRILPNKAKKYMLQGISEANYKKMEGFRQTDNICNICLYPPSIPTRIQDCGHEFCFACLKSNYMMGLECPTCRGRIPSELFRDPKRYDLPIDIECPIEYANDCTSMFALTEEGKGSANSSVQLRRSQRSTRTKYYWIYQATDYGWYRYDPKNEKYLEESYIRKKSSCTIFICGFKMSINLKSNVQERISEGEVHRRKIKRIKAGDLKNHRVRGISGIQSYAYPVISE
ncbi:hypothetical protein GCK72_024406 [Caenorhabditis remanei]|uniref:RING-type E3 ubiquitin transferase n=1 Tax=Caenorhabditis remanei TaxID=31234 RepID=E3LE26_CAERE|nr:hypothetical protein GCK72_024406 [Caenorhabditis remanei]EFO82377.1 hypothetical protein CRE_00251 [Caenorhabditis remanei]KAF1747940.1 hypothetical protein GCK72_024406 [Caenorhabditis remanei]